MKVKNVLIIFSVSSANILGHIIRIYKFVSMKNTVCSDTKADPKNH